ncbi:putative Lysine-specific demethylase 4B [Hypsibius exemplaris]|uniref:Lysine-specific demethylase 4B n=1 Tax=Hypsibius exemplaris TaxID=2072580 RepID=A0A1W0W9Y5_HYPEX|nr:putative Lysine-specific demethylase 4B [Hypsibius exemplaris]
MTLSARCSTEKEALHSTREDAKKSSSTIPTPVPIQNCITLRPTMEEFRDELAFLSSEAVQNAGKKCGIVRVVTPKEFDPTRSYTLADANSKPDLWTLQVSVLEQQFLPIKTRKMIQPGKFMVGRRQDQPYPCGMDEWMELGERMKRETEELMVKRLGVEEAAIPSDMSDGNSARKHFWKSRPYQVCAPYGADIPQSAMRPDLTCWNFASDNFPCLTRIFQTNRTPGVYTPYLYLGQWGTSFGLHPEDKDLYSLNYLHEGDQVLWYGIPSTNSQDVEQFAAELLPNEAKACDQFLRHKTLLVEPRFFAERGIPIFAAEQKARDLMITFPNAYHYGFNNGFNVAESRNIATPDWLEIGLKAKQCTCKTYRAPDVLPRHRILEMAKQCDAYKYLTVPHHPSSVVESTERVKKSRRM